jgi:hypothetical protein
MLLQGASLPDRCWLYSVFTAVLMSRPDRCWLYSVCTAVLMSRPDKCWLYSLCTALRGWESTGQVLAILCMYSCAYESTGQVLAIFCMYCCAYESTGQVLAIFCMYCCAWVGIYRTGAGYTLYILLCVVGNQPDRCWLYSVCTALRGWESTGQVVAIHCMYCCACVGIYRTGAGSILYVLLCVGDNLPDRCWLYSVYTAVRGWESTGQMLALLCMYFCALLGVYRTGAGYILYVLLCVVGSLPDSCWLYCVDAAGGG